MKDAHQEKIDALNAIATKYFGVESLVQDIPPLFNVSIKAMSEALEAAFNAGHAQSVIQFYDKTYQELGVFDANSLHDDDGGDNDDENEDNDEGEDINVKTSLLIEALIGQEVEFEGYSCLDFGVFNHDDLDEADGEIRFYPFDKRTREISGRNEVVISFSDIEKGQLNSKGYFECVDIGGHPVKMTSSILQYSVQHGDKMLDVLSRVSPSQSGPSL